MCHAGVLAASGKWVETVRNLLERPFALPEAGVVIGAGERSGGSERRNGAAGLLTPVLTGHGPGDSCGDARVLLPATRQGTDRYDSHVGGSAQSSAVTCPSSPSS